MAITKYCTVFEAKAITSREKLSEKHTFVTDLPQDFASAMIASY